jgi:hypothetical protein
MCEIRLFWLALGIVMSSNFLAHDAHNNPAGWLLLANEGLGCGAPAK